MAREISEGKARRKPPLYEYVAALLFVAYAVAFWLNLEHKWFNSDWTTDDALQQIFPFYKAIYPQLFQGDLITKMMEGYLAPIHYAIGFSLTWLTSDPLMAGHWIMLLQLVSTLLFLFFGVRAAAGTVPAFFAATWLLHTRLLIQRLTGGLPRGWSASIFAAYFYCALKGQMNGVIAVIAVGCALHTPATLIVALSHGLFLLWMSACKETRATYKPHLIRYIIVAPFFVAFAFFMVQMPEDLGTMANLATAQKMPEFHAGGRFPFLPFEPMLNEIHTFGFEAFIGRLYNPGPFLHAFAPAIVVLLLLLLVVVAAKKRYAIIPEPLLCFFIATAAVYVASRPLAFRLYVPSRHLQFPVEMFFIAAFSVGFWRLLVKSGRTQAFVGLVLLGTFIAACSGSGLQGSANFNVTRTHKGEAFEWIRANTPENALIAGDPTFLDDVELFGVRTGYATTETAHPFYDRYYGEIKRRLHITLAAEYAPTLKEFLKLLEPEKIDYFVFEREKFLPNNLANASYLEPFNAEVASMAHRTPPNFAYFELKKLAGEGHFAPLVFHDRYALIVDLRELRSYLTEHESDRALP